jgi:hypothetical protein
MKGKDFEGNSRDLILKYCSGIRLEGLRETTNNLSQDSWSPSPDLNPGPPKNEVLVLAILAAQSGRGWNIL